METALDRLCVLLAPYRRMNGRTPPIVFTEALFVTGVCDSIDPAHFGMEDLVTPWAIYRAALNNTIFRPLAYGEIKPGSVEALASGCSCDRHAIADLTNNWPIWVGCPLHGTWRTEQ